MLRAHFAYCVDTEPDSIQCFEGGWGNMWQELAQTQL